MVCGGVTLQTLSGDRAASSAGCRGDATGGWTAGGSWGEQGKSRPSSKVASWNRQQFRCRGNQGAFVWVKTILLDMGDRRSSGG